MTATLDKTELARRLGFTAPAFQLEMHKIAAQGGLPVLDVYALWISYWQVYAFRYESVESAATINAESSDLLAEQLVDFVEVYASSLGL